MNYQEVAAPHPFDRLVSCVWFLTGQAQQYPPQPVVPDGRLELLVHLGDPFSRLTRDGSSHRQDRLLLAGQLTGPIHLAPRGWMDVVGIRFTPLGAHAILTMPLAPLSNQVVSLVEIHPRLARELETAATRPLGRRERAQLILHVLSRFISDDPDPRIGAALARLEDDRPWSLARVAAHSDMSTRTMERCFLQKVGLTPKMYQRVVRFRRAFRLLGDAGQKGGAIVAGRAGYFDQAHLIRDFKQFTGASPKRFFRPETPLAGLLLSGLAGDTPHREIDAAGRGALGTFDPGH